MTKSPLKSIIASLLIGSFCLTLPAASASEKSEFQGTIKRDIKDSKQHWPEPKLPPKGAPNVLIWMIDDAGFGHLSSYGGAIETPNLDRLSNAGVRFNNFHVTPVCSSTRAALLSGRNPHRSHVGAHAAGAVGFPGYDAHKPDTIATIADMLKEQGYITYAIGKWDHLPTKDATPAGPYDYWPSGQGFDRFYGFLAADTDNFRPSLWSDHSPVETPTDPDYHLSADMADKAIQWITDRSAMPQKAPFFMYWATGAVHAPHHAPAKYIERYHGRFDAGWDKIREQTLARQKELGIVPPDTKLPPRSEGMEPWDSLNDKQKKSYARAMEAFAAQLTYTDEQFGRIVDYLSKSGELDNTMIIVVSDNGASAEGGLNGTYNENMVFNGLYPTVEQNLAYYDRWGGPETFPHVPFGWTVAGNTPFRYYKQTTYEGGSRVPLIISWPKGIAQQGQIREQFHFVTDLAPTILSAAKLPFPETVNGVEQEPLDGIDMRYTFANPDKPSQRSVQYLELMGNLAIFENGWKAVNKHRVITWELPSHLDLHENWELYDLNNDFNELNNLAAEEPEKLHALTQLFEQEAAANQVFPIISAPMEIKKLLKKTIGARLMERGGLYVYNAPISRIPEWTGPPLTALPFEISASIRLSAEQAGKISGPIFALGGRIGGMSLYLADGQVKFLYHNVDGTKTQIDSAVNLPAGESLIKLVFDKDKKGGGTMRMSVNGKEVGSSSIPGPMPHVLSLDATFDIGSDSGSLVSQEYAGAPVFAGQLNELRVQLKLPLLARILIKAKALVH